MDLLSPELAAWAGHAAVDLCASGSLQLELHLRTRGEGFTGPFDASARLEIDSIGYSQTVTRSLSAEQPERVEQVEIALPPEIPAGEHEVRVSLTEPLALPAHPSSFSISPADPVVSLDVTPARAGDAGRLRVTNQGMRPAGLGWELSLVSPAGQRVHEDAGGGPIAACGGEQMIDFEVPEGIAAGRYVLLVLVQADDQAPEAHRYPLDLAGLEAGLELWTSKDVYRLGEDVQGLGSLVNGPEPLAGASLHLEVARLAGGAGQVGGDWPAFGHDMTRSSFSPGKGEITAPRLAWQVVIPEWAEPLAGDLDGDGSADMVIDDNYSCSAYRGQDGAQLWYHAYEGYHAAMPVIADVDTDGHAEVLVAGQERLVCLSGADGAVEWEIAREVGSSSQGGLGAADLDRDGTVEIFGVETLGDHTCLSVRAGADGAPLRDSCASGMDLSAGWSLAAADMDGDGDLEILGASSSPRALAAFHHDGTLHWQWDSADDYIHYYTLADLDHDGSADVVATLSGYPDPSYFAALSGLDGSPLWQASGTAGTARPSSPVVAADLDGDGSVDLATAFSYLITAVDGNGGLMWTQDTNYVRGLSAADIDSDGSVELVVLSWDYGLSLYTLDGATGNLEWDSYEHGLDLTGISPPVLADFDADGWLEIGITNDDPFIPEFSLVVVDSQDTAGPAAGGAVVEQVLWERDRDVALAGSETLPIDELPGALDAVGQLYFRGWLSSGLGQELARDSYPFAIADGDLSVSLQTDRELYKQGASVQVSGLARELAGLGAEGVELQVLAGDALVHQELFDLEAGGSHGFAFELDAGSPGAHDLRAVLVWQAVEVAGARARYRVEQVSLQFELEAPELADSAPFEIRVRVTSDCSLPAEISIALTGPGGAETRELELGPGDTQVEVFERQIDADAHFDVEASGDAGWSAGLDVLFGLSSFLEVEPMVAAGHEGGRLEIAWTLSNRGRLPSIYGFEIAVLDAGGEIAGQLADERFLAMPGDPDGLDRASGLFGLDLPFGDYRVLYRAEHGNQGERELGLHPPSAEAWLMAEPVVPAGEVVLGWGLQNSSSPGAAFGLEQRIEDAGGALVQAWTQAVWLEAAGSEGDAISGRLAADLEPGAYTARVAGEYIAPAEAGFEVLPVHSIALALSPQPASCGQQHVEAALSNAGFSALDGSLAVRSRAWQAEQAVHVDGQGGAWSGAFLLSLSQADAGSHPVAFRLCDGRGASVLEEGLQVEVRPGECGLVSAPPHQHFAAGERASFDFAVRNTGDRAARCRLALAPYEEQGPEQAELLLAPCEQATVSLGYLLPAEIEACEDALAWTLGPADAESRGEASGFASFSVDGLSLDVLASLDDCFYRPGDTALLALQVASSSAASGLPLLVRVGYAGIELERVFTLTDTPQQLAFELDLGELLSDRILYTFSFLSGRAVHIDSRRIHGHDRPLWLCSDRDRYDAGDTVGVSFGSDADCLFVLRDLAAGWEHEQPAIAGETYEASYDLPLEMRQGTHVLEYGCDLLSERHPYEIRAVGVRFVSLEASTTRAEPGDPISAEAVVDASAAFEGWAVMSLLPPDGDPVQLAEGPAALEAGTNRLSLAGSLPADWAGRGELVFALYLDAERSAYLGSDRSGIQIGSFELVAVGADRPRCESGLEGALCLVQLRGDPGTEAELGLFLDDQELYSGRVALDGFSSLSIPMSAEALRALGRHAIRGRLSSGDAGCERSAEIETVDTRPPEIRITGVEQGAIYPAPVTPEVEVLDVNPGSLAVRLDGAVWRSGLIVPYEGEHLLDAQAIDAAGNSSAEGVAFSLDRSAPAIAISGVEDGACYDQPVAPVFAVTDAHLASVEALLDGAPFASGELTGEGAHALEIRALDLAGHESARSLSFTVDLSDPQILVSGVQDGQVGELDVQPEVEIDDRNLVASSVVLDGAALEPGTVVSGEGEHLLQAWALDCAGRSASASARFRIDRSPPEISLVGIEHAGCYPPPVWPGYAVWDASLSSVSAELDGQAFDSGTEVSAEGVHVLRVEAVDAVGHASLVEAEFVLDGTEPALEVGGIEPGGLYADRAAAVFSAGDANLTSVLAELDGAPYASGEEIAIDGEHRLEIRAWDCAGNQAAFDADFTIDASAPVIAVSGVEPGGVYAGPVYPEIQVADAHLATWWAELDGEAFESGTEVSAPGEHWLWVEAEDTLGHTSELGLDFSISHLGLPEFRWAICAFEDVLLLDRFEVASEDTSPPARCHGGHGPAWPAGHGDVAAHGDVGLHGYARIDGELVAGGDVRLLGRSAVTGDVYLAGRLCKRWGARVGGEVIELELPPEPCECGFDLDAALAMRALANDNAQLEADPEIAPYLVDGALLLDRCRRRDKCWGCHPEITLPEGVYYFDRVVMRDSARLRVAPGARVEIWTARDFDLGGCSRLDCRPGDGCSLLVVSGADDAAAGRLRLRARSDLVLDLYAPRAALWLGPWERVHGSVVVRRFVGQDRSELLVPEERCEDDPPPLTCE
ncbi:MAG: hypothetical protein JXR96_28395 [Deltaproteobacteria bacterium]|nr:hypothetical protein [Deltaproteobacteria bacterium]